MEAVHNIGILFRGFTGLTLAPCRSIPYPAPGHTFNTVLWKTPLFRISGCSTIVKKQKRSTRKTDAS